MTSESSWTFLTNHAIVLMSIAAEPKATLREIAKRVGITERAVHRIVTDLAADDYLVVHKDGRRNHYEVRGSLPLRQEAAKHVPVADLLATLIRSEPGA